MPKFGIIHCYDSDKWWPLGSNIWRDALQRSGDEWFIYNLTGKGELPKPEDNLDGVIITGSHRGAYDDLPWIQRLAEWIRSNADVGSPEVEQHVASAGLGAGAVPAARKLRIVGGCFGAQLIGKALGGVVEPQGFFVLKAEEIKPTAAFATMPFAAGLETLAPTAAAAAAVAPGSGQHDQAAAAAAEPHFRLLESHGDCVRTLPPGSTLLASSASCENEIFVVGRNCFGIQSHPEFDVDHVIEDVIWPRVVDQDHRIDHTQELEAKESFKLPRHDAEMLNIINAFLRQRVD